MRTAAYIARLTAAGVDPKLAQAHGEAIEALLTDNYVTRDHLDSKLAWAAGVDLPGDVHAGARRRWPDGQPREAAAVDPRFEFSNGRRTMYVVDYGEVFTDFTLMLQFYRVSKSGVIWTITHER
jgi:hypothetical protein